MSEVQGLLEIDNTHRPRGGPMLLGIQGYLAHKKVPPPQDRRRALGGALDVGLL